MKRMAGMGVKFLILIKAMAPGKCPLRAPTKKMRDAPKMLLCRVPRADKATRI